MCVAAFAIVPPGPAVGAWHVSHDPDWGWGDGGGAPWHVPHAFWLPSTTVHFGAVRLPPSSVAPWQYEPPHVAVTRSHAGAAPSVTDSPPNTTSASGLPSRCPAASTVPGTTWHASHATAFPSVARRCDWCAPTVTSPVPLRPAVSTGGAAFVPLPWHELHAPPTTCT